MSAAGADATAPVRVGLVGAGTIAGPYVQGLRATPGFEPVAVAARRPETAAAFAAEHGLDARSVADLLAAPDIDYVLNLTPAHAHDAITAAALSARKPVYSEKPLATSLAEADRLIALAASCGLLLACAPATTLWPPLATVRQSVEEGAIGQVVAAVSTLVYPGPELFHPAPRHLYDAAAGPLRDMGIYQVAALLAILGPVARVAAMTSRRLAEREVLVGPDQGQRFPVEGPTHVQAQLEHHSGAISSLIISFDGVASRAATLEIIGSVAALFVSDSHSPDARITLNRPAQAPQNVASRGESGPALRAIGPTSAWHAHRRREDVPTSAARARAAMAVIDAIERAAAEGKITTPH